jgi:hypothetical protein
VNVEKRKWERGREEEKKRSNWSGGESLWEGGEGKKRGQRGVLGLRRVRYGQVWYCGEWSGGSRGLERRSRYT